MYNNLISKNSYFDNNKLYEKIYKNEEFYLIKEKKVYKIAIINRKDDIMIKCSKYEINLNNNDLSILIGIQFNKIEDIYDFIINIFKQKKVIIKDSLNNKSIQLLFKTKIFNKEKEFEINLINNDNNNNNLNTKEINNNSKTQNSNIEKNNKNPYNIHFLNDLINNSYSYYSFLDNTFCLFKSLYESLYLIYTNINKSIISFNLIENKKMNEIKNAHNEYITNFRYYLDRINKKDLIISISGNDNNIKLWNIINTECLLDLKNINNNGNLYSGCFLNNNNQTYLVTSNYNYYGICEPIKIFDFNGNKIKEIEDSNDQTYFIDSYFDNQLNITFIVTGNKNNVKSYDFYNNEIYHKYDDNDNKGHYSIIIYLKDNKVKLIELSDDKNVRIWNFHLGELLEKIKVSQNYSLSGLCLWQNEYLFVGCYDKTIKLIQLNNGKIIKSLSHHNKKVLTIKKIYHPEYGECLISQGLDQKIKLWINKSK